jgi:hypothetical protein
MEIFLSKKRRELLMKKIFAMIMTICLMAIALCVTTFAEEAPAAGTVMRVRRQSGSNEPTFVADYDNFEEGWNEAMELADDTGARVIVDLYADWISDEEGRFSDDWINGSGFKHDTIYFQNGVAFTLNMNGHTIHRRLADIEADGEVMYIDSNADVTINNGTITGGRTNNGAGGIHVNGAEVYLNDVRVVDNKGLREDYGGGIALYGNSKLVMKGGELRDNFADHRGGAVYLGDSGITAEFYNVKIINNGTGHGSYMGGAIAYIYGTDCNLKFTNCEMYANYGSNLILAIEDNSNVYMDGCDIHGNAGYSIVSLPTDSLFSEHYLEVKNTRIHDNASSSYAFHTVDTKLYIENVTVVDNTTLVIASNDSYGTIKNCTFNNNAIDRDVETIWVDEDCVDDITFYNCNFGDSTFKYEVKIVSTDSTGAVMGICVQKADGTLGTVDYYKKQEYGWTDAMKLAQTLKGKARVVVDLYADWTAVEGQFTDNFNNDVGFDWDAIHIPQNVRVTFNLNGHKIDRALTTDESNGEVICIDKNADVIINDGTITGGWSNNGAGGIHIKDNATVVLNNVKVDGNAVRGDDGAAIAVYNGAKLIMNGGSISNNFMRASVTVFDIEVSPYGALYANESTVTLNNVTLSDNYTFDSAAEGVAIYATESTVAINKCIVSGNAVAKEGRYNAKSVIAGYDSKFIITDTDFTNNASDGGDNCYGDSRLFYFEDSRLTMEGGKITQNNPQELLYFEDSDADINKVTITDNASVVIYVDNDSEKVNMNECTLNKNASIDNAPDIQVETKGTLAMNDCVIGDTNFEDKGKVEGVGSLFGEGSLAMIVAFVALIASIASIIVNVTARKKKTVPVTATEQSEDDE